MISQSDSPDNVLKPGVPRWLQVIVAFAIVWVLSSCSEPGPQFTYDSESGQATMRIPADLPMFRAVDSEQLSVDVFLNGISVGSNNINRDNVNQWSAKLDLERSTQYEIRIEWAENFDDELVKLGVATEYISIVDATPVTLIFNNESLDISFDDDGDKVFNLTERNNGTSPVSADNLPEQKNVNFFFQLPDAARDIGLTESDNLHSIRVNGVASQLSVTSSIPYQVSFFLVPDQEVFVEMNWYWNNNRNVRLGRIAKRFTLPEDLNLTLVSDDFRTDYDADSDGVSNLDEIAAGTDPLLP